MEFPAYAYDAIKDHEKKTNHDIKAVEYYLKQELANLQLEPFQEMIHFLCTSEDVNNLAYSLMIKNFVSTCLLPKLEEIQEILVEMSSRMSEDIMMARTHGQPASPTVLGKEIANFGYRIARQIEWIRNSQFMGKLNGAVGNFNCHNFVVDDVDWKTTAQMFVEDELGLKFNLYW